MEEFPEVSEEAIYKCEDARNFEQFLLHFWVEYTQSKIDPVDILKKNLASLSSKDFENLLRELDIEYPENHYRVLCRFFNPILDLTPLLKEIRLDFEEHSQARFVGYRLIPTNDFN